MDAYHECVMLLAQDFRVACFLFFFPCVEVLFLVCVSICKPEDSFPLHKMSGDGGVVVAVAAVDGQARLLMVNGLC